MYICIHLLTISKHLQPSLFDPSGRSLRPCPERDRDGKACLEFKNGAGPWKLRGRHRRIWWFIIVDHHFPECSWHSHVLFGNFDAYFDHHFQAQSRVVCWIGWQPHVTVIFDPSPDCDNSLANEEQIHPEGYNWGYSPLKKMGEYTNRRLTHQGYDMLLTTCDLWDDPPHRPSKQFTIPFGRVPGRQILAEEQRKLAALEGLNEAALGVLPPARLLLHVVCNMWYKISEILYRCNLYCISIWATVNTHG